MGLYPPESVSWSPERLREMNEPIDLLIVDEFPEDGRALVASIDRYLDEKRAEFLRTRRYVTAAES